MRAVGLSAVAVLFLAGLGLMTSGLRSGVPVARAATHNVSITAGGFAPDPLTIAVGDTVTWKNNSATPQTAVAQVPGTDPRFFTSGFIYAGNSYSHTFTVVGTVPYKSLTTGKLGTLIIEAAAGTPTATATAAGTTPPPGGGGGRNVSITADGFSPDPITIAVGDTVTWTNNSATPQTAVAQVPGTDPRFFSSGFIYAGKSYSHTFTVVGTVPYKSLTTGSLGTLIVEGGPGATWTPTLTATTVAPTATATPTVTATPTSGLGTSTPTATFTPTGVRGTPSPTATPTPTATAPGAPTGTTAPQPPTPTQGPPPSGGRTPRSVVAGLAR